MPEKTKHKGLRAYIFHGVDFDVRDGDEEAVATCPFCMKKGKFFCNTTTGLFDCKVCGAQGGAYNFIRRLWEESTAEEAELEELRVQRGLLETNTLRKWGLVRSLLTNEWLLPAYGVEGALNLLYRYVRLPDSPEATNRYKLFATPDLTHALYGVPVLQRNEETLLVCEGPWDAMALWEVLAVSKRGEGGLTYTANPAVSLLVDCAVLATPSCQVWQQNWNTLLAHKKVCLLYDNDHAQVHPKTGALLAPAGYSGMQRAAGFLAAAEEPPVEVNYLHWGEGGFDTTLASGYDVRDWLKEELEGPGRVRRLDMLLQKVQPIPNEWVAGRGSSRHRGGTEMDCLSCKEWATLINAWRKAFKWTEGLDRALSVMLAVVASTKAVGDQLWARIMGMPGSGKTTLCEALSVNKKWVVAKSTIRGFHSGFKSDKHGEEDNALVARLYDMTLVTKDGDTLIQSPNLGQILSEARDLYDCTSRTHYRNKMSRDYNGVRMTWLLCGTSSLRQLDSSELGERFLDCVIMEEIDAELEDEILWRKANQAERSMAYEADGKLTTQHDPDLVKAMQLTGGYVGYLRTHARQLLAATVMPEAPLRRCIDLGKFIAYMRAKPSTKQEEVTEKELATRLVSQMVRLAKCLTVVLNKTRVDDEVMYRVLRVALDTSRGRTLEITRHLYRERTTGAVTASLATWCIDTDENMGKMLRFLRKIGVVQRVQKQVGTTVKYQNQWQLTPAVQTLYARIAAGIIDVGAVPLLS